MSGSIQQQTLSGFTGEGRVYLRKAPELYEFFWLGCPFETLVFVNDKSDEHRKNSLDDEEDEDDEDEEEEEDEDVVDDGNDAIGGNSWGE